MSARFNELQYIELRELDDLQGQELRDGNGTCEAYRYRVATDLHTNCGITDLQFLGY
jgi:hypothetical protein